MEAKHILLTTDLSEEAQRAFQPIASLARRLGARITLLHAVQLMTKVPPGSMLATPLAVGDPEQEKAAAQETLEVQKGLLGPDLDVEIEVIVAESIAREIARWAQEHEVDLIALSTHGRTGLRRMMLGSVAEELLRHAHVPVLGFPPGAGEE